MGVFVFLAAPLFVTPVVAVTGRVRDRGCRGLAVQLVGVFVFLAARCVLLLLLLLLVDRV